MARITIVDYENTKEKLLEVGLAFFGTQGYNGTGLQEIATQAGISKGSFYSYFSSKEDFGVHVIRYYTNMSLNSWQLMLEESIKSNDANKALHSTFINIIDKYKTSDRKKGCLVGALASEISEASEACRIELNSSIIKYKGLLSKYVDIGKTQGVIRKDLETESLAGLIWDCWQGSLLRMKVEHSIEPVTMDLEILFKSII